MHRREFLFALSAAGVLARTTDASAASTTLVGPNEPGSRLIVRGRVFGADGRTPVAGVRLFVYHTDAQGHYSQPVDNPRTARIRGTLVSAADGSYEISTIKPAPYPVLRPASHIHVHLQPPGAPNHGIDSFLFEGDPYLTSAQTQQNAGLGRFSAVMRETADARGVILCERDIRIDPALFERNRLVGE